MWSLEEEMDGVEIEDYGYCQIDVEKERFDFVGRQLTHTSSMHLVKDKGSVKRNGSFFDFRRVCI